MDLARKNKVTGGDKVIKNLQSVVRSWENSVGAGIYLELNNIMGISKRLVPVDLGTLKNSGYVTLPQKVGTKVLVEIGYGGAAKDYAVYVHEIPSPEEGAPHPEQWSPGKRTAQHRAPTTWKYLEHPINERQANITKNVLALAKQHFQQGGAPVAKGTLPTDPFSGGE